MPETTYDSVKRFTSSKSVTPALSRQELLEVSQNISLYFAPRISSNNKKLVLLSIDPQHLYAYWNFDDDESQNKTPSSSNTSDNKMLRIYSQEVRGDVVKSKPLVEFKIQGSQAKQLISLPIINRKETYFAKIGELNSSKNFIPLIISNNTACFSRQKKLKKISFTDYIIPYNNIEFKIKEQSKLKKTHRERTNYSGKVR